MSAKLNAERQAKANTVASLQEMFGDKTEMVVITKNLGLTVADASKLRDMVRNAGASYKVAKNTLVKIALKGTAFEELSSKFEGPTAITAASDPVAAAKAIADFAKANDKLEIVGAGFNGQVLTAEAVKTLAKLPSLNELRAKIVGLLQAPATKVAGVLQAPAGQLARLLSAKAAKEA